MTQQFKEDILKSYKKDKLNDYQYFQLVCFEHLVQSLSSVAQGLKEIRHDLCEYLQKSSK